MLLVDRDGQKLLVHFDKNGYYYVFDRVARKLLRARQFARVTWGSVDSLTGKVTAVKLVPTDSGTVICPGAAGAKEWSHTAYSPRTNLVYVPVVEQCGKFSKLREDFREGLPYWGGTPAPLKDEHWGYVKAIDVLSGREVWSHRTQWPVVASMLATAGDVVFTGEATGEVDAFDARTGALLWQFQTGSGIHSNAVTYSVRGKQYVAVPSGWGGWAKGFAPGLAAAPRGDALYVFSLP
jgi:alcohol dehydrogenase (cytochrome c)